VGFDAGWRFAIECSVYSFANDSFGRWASENTALRNPVMPVADGLIG
jgi:hypothetical protein